MTNLVLCGGSGTRLWPLSRTLMPKQFIKFFDNKSLFQLTVMRNSHLCDSSLIVLNQEQYFLALDQLEEIDSCHSSYLLESVGRDTAPAIALACMSLEPSEVVLVTPSDHLIVDQEAYAKVVQRASTLAHDNYLVTFGISPTSAQTGFGYIESADAEDVKAFHEKPDSTTAQKYFEAGNYYWNSGMFVFRVEVFLQELQKHSPAIYEACQTAYRNSKQDIVTRVPSNDMLAIPKDSIDYAVMEKSGKVKMVPADIGWSDVGSFDALCDELPKDENGNIANHNHTAIDSKNNMIYGSNRMIATVDVDDLIIVDTEDALLVSKKGSSQKVKEVVQRLQANHSELCNIHQTAHRPWGTYTVLEDTLKYKIKKIEVKSGKRLSLQKHYHRNEHWVVVSGTATVTVNDETKLVRPNESTYIKAGEIHRLANDGIILLVLIEVQMGEYMGEDDIVRIEDDFQRF